MFITTQHAGELHKCYYTEQERSLSEDEPRILSPSSHTVTFFRRVLAASVLFSVFAINAVNTIRMQ